jgi:ABC-2 type transport system ATP-binding protein
MTQRLGLAAALVGEPHLLILDEPTSALDPAGRAEILSLIAELRNQCTVIFSSHILADVQRVADQVGILRAGRMLYQGPTTVLVERYLQPRWHLRIAGDTTAVTDALAQSDWVKNFTADQSGLRIEAVTVEAGERGIPAVIAATGSRLVACEPVAADLESAFLALTAEPAR